MQSNGRTTDLADIQAESQAVLDTIKKRVPEMLSTVGETPDTMYKLPGGQYRSVLMATLNSYFTLVPQLLARTMYFARSWLVTAGFFQLTSR
jgi:hypothetical protein